jgi:hypothetical protein
VATIESTTEIRPFSVEVPEEDLVDLRKRIAATRWPEGTRALHPGSARGVSSATNQ